MGDSVQEVKSKITNCFLDQFSKIISEDAKESEVHEICLGKVRWPIGIEKKQLKAVKTLDDYVEKNFFVYLCDYLQSEELVDTIKLSEFHSTERYMSFLDKQDVDLVMGPKNTLQIMLPENEAFLDDFIMDKTCIFVDCWNDTVLLLKKEMLKLYLHEIRIPDVSHPGELKIKISVSIRTNIDKNGCKAKMLVADWNNLANYGFKRSEKQ